MTLLTCFTDASFCDRSKAAGWGGWAIRKDWGRGRFYGGAILHAVTNPNEAEMAAVLELLRAVNAQHELATATALMIQSDSMSMLAALIHLIPGSRWKASSDSGDVQEVSARRRFSPVEGQIGGALAGICGSRIVYLRHVKGHSDASGGRSWVNAQCDREAKRHMQARRNGVSASYWLDPV